MPAAAATIPSISTSCSTLNVATNLRDNRTNIDDNGNSVDIQIDADGNGSFELTIMTLETSSTVKEGTDVVFGTL